jgi:hypothetical protein
MAPPHHDQEEKKDGTCLINPHIVLMCLESTARVSGDNDNSVRFLISSREAVAILRLGFRLMIQSPLNENKKGASSPLAVDGIAMTAALSEMALSCDASMLRYSPKPNTAIAVRRCCENTLSRRQRKGPGSKGIAELKAAVDRFIMRSDISGGEEGATTKKKDSKFRHTTMPIKNNNKKHTQRREPVAAVRRSVDSLADSLARNAQLQAEMRMVSAAALAQRERIRDLEDKLLDSWTGGEHSRRAADVEDARDAEAAMLAAAEQEHEEEEEGGGGVAEVGVREKLGRMKVLVATPTGGTVLEVFAPSQVTATVASLKAAIEVQHGLPPAAQILVNRHGKRMDAWRTLSSYGVVDSERVTLMMNSSPWREVCEK